MTKFLQSGRRRDVCALLAGEQLQAQALKSRLESHYDERIEPKSFYGALDALEDGGFVTTDTEGIHDVYLLTDAGEKRLREHYDWLGEQLDSSKPQ
ncbi:MAG: DNA-binding PadR family transcriptional regulator [Haloarculaceae archaeon]|jgi:DNA-binding PadR family transcriptional regulator